MYQDVSSAHKTMGDVDVLYHDGVYHLFHLVLPNHDFIAHAISTDGLNWHRVRNALFIGHPGSWDDHMLWTMHVSADPWQPGRWRMFYTGVARRGNGYVQRIGCAYSRDLVEWEKAPDRWADVPRHPSVDAPGCLEGPYDPESPFPIEALPPYYESETEKGRPWVSFRDPFYFHEDGVGRLLVAARVADGPFIRRGCVALLTEERPDEFRHHPPLHHPGQYDDIEVPNLFKLQGRYYLVGSQREDAKVRYWSSHSLDGPWGNFFDNVILPAGNYAARISFDDRGPLIWNFFSLGADRLAKNLMPPPKRITVRDDGRLTIRSFEGFDCLVSRSLHLRELLPLSKMLQREGPVIEVDETQERVTLSSEAGFEGFRFADDVISFRLKARLSMKGLGKCGLIFRIDPETTSGYHVSLDLLKGVAQLRAWGEEPGAHPEEVFVFRSLQAAYWQSNPEGPWNLQLTAMGNYLELAIDDHVLLTLSDDTYRAGGLGFYVESGCIRVDQIVLDHLAEPHKPTEQLPTGGPAIPHAIADPQR